MSPQVSCPAAQAGGLGLPLGRALATLDQQQARIEELEEELTSARQVLPSLTWHRAMRFLLDEIPHVGADTAREDWSPEFADIVRRISEGRGMDLADLEELEISISRLRAAVAAVEEEAADDVDR
jgi:hypothetical protein